MAVVPTYESQRKLEPTQWDPKVAGTKGAEIQDFAEGLKGLGEKIQKLDDRRQTLKAETYLAKQHMGIRQFAATDPHLDQLDEAVDQKSQDAVMDAANLITSPVARQDFVAKANLDIERRNVSVYNTILRRKSQDFKSELTQANDADIQEYQSMTDPGERKLLRQKILDRTNQAVNDGHVNADWAHAHAVTLLKAADLNQVKGDMAIDAAHTYEQLQKGKEGLYPTLNDAQRKQFADRAQKMIEKQGSDNKLIYSIAQNSTENNLIDKMAQNKLTQQDINDAQIIGNKGIRIRPEFAKAATDALADPFPTESVPEKYNKLVSEIQDPDMDPMTLKLNVLKARGLTPQEKAHLIDAHLSEDQGEGKKSINDLINLGIKQNKDALMQADKNLKKELADRSTMLRKITDRFMDHAKDDAHLASLQQEYMNKLQNVKDDKERMSLAQEILNRDTLRRNPGIATADPKGTIFMDKSTGAKRKYFPSGWWEPVKSNEQ